MFIEHATIFQVGSDEQGDDVGDDGHHGKCDRREVMTMPAVALVIWDFPKIRGTLFWSPYNKDPTI